VVGTSLGGFCANYFANHVGARGAILINPVVDSQELMRVMQGENYSERRQKSFEVAEEAVMAYGTVQPVENPQTEMLVLLTKDDAVLRYQEAVQVFSAASRARIEIFETGGHSPPLGRPDIMAAIRQFIEEKSLP